MQNILLLLHIETLRSLHKGEDPQQPSQQPWGQERTKIPPSLSSIQCLGALSLFKCFFGPRTMLNNFYCIRCTRNVWQSHIFVDHRGGRGHADISCSHQWVVLMGTFCFWHFFSFRRSLNNHFFTRREVTRVRDYAILSMMIAKLMMMPLVSHVKSLDAR